MDRLYGRAEIGRLAAISRAYHEARADIIAALVQELDEDPAPEWYSDVAAYFGMTVDEVRRLSEVGVKAVYQGYVHRANLLDETEVYARVLAHIADGTLPRGVQLPPRTKFTQIYRCDKKTHGEVVARLQRAGIVHRPAGGGGPLYIL